MHVYMTRIISISDEAYESLKNLKREMSFSKIIIELARIKKKNNIMELAGAWDNEMALKIKKEILKERKNSSRRMQ